MKIDGRASCSGHWKVATHFEYDRNGRGRGLCRKRCRTGGRGNHRTEAAKLSDPQRVALEKATAACKVEAKGMKFTWHWRKRQKYVQNCIIRSASQQGIDIWEIRRAVKQGDLLSQDIDDWSFVFSRSRNR
jgi:hypothetical protein